MANRILALGGKPATGKTTLLRDVINTYKPYIKFNFGLVRGMYFSKHSLYIIGIYDKSVFSGTDKLSMAVQPDFIRFCSKITDGKILFEGDRLFNQSLFNKVDCDIIIIEVNENTEKLRHKKRNDNQSQKFIKSKHTKIENIKKNNSVNLYNNNTKKQYKEILNKIKYFCTK
jgi:dephospho-CoA kinase